LYVIKYSAVANKKFRNLETMYGAHWMITAYNTVGYVHDFPKFGAGNFYQNHNSVIEGTTNKLIMEVGEYEKTADYLSSRLINDDAWREKMYAQFYDYANRFFDAGENLRKLTLSGLSDDKLAEEVEAILPLHHNERVIAVIINGFPIDGCNHLSNKIRGELGTHIPKERFEEYWTLLSQTTKLSLRQERDLKIMELAGEKNEGVVAGKLRELHEKYCWLDYMYLGPPTPYKEFERLFERAKKDSEAFDFPKHLLELKKKQETLMDELGLNARARFLINLTQTVIWQKGWRKDVEYHAFYCYEKLFREIARRKKEKDWRVFTNLLPWELTDFIQEGGPTINELKERKKFSALHVTAKGYKMYVGEEARRFCKKLDYEENHSHLSEAKGMCAYAGKARGPAKIIHTPDEMSKMEPGDILISQATSPDLLPAMVKASAIVTNTGGLICHAAITARELKIPCIVGTGNATRIFKDGDRVEVDAEKGLIRKIE